MKTVYHCTTRENAERILKGGFNGDHRVWFTKKKHIAIWMQRLLENGSITNVVIQMTMTDEFYRNEIFDWDEDPYSKGQRGQLCYGEGKNGWNDPIKRPPLTSNTDGVIKMEIMAWG